MKPMNDRTQSAQAAGTPAPRKRYRIQKLEERIAPKKGGIKTYYCYTDFHCTRACGF
jgi:hypothetical protein